MCQALMPSHAPLQQAVQKNPTHLLSSAQRPLVHAQPEVRQGQVVEGVSVSGICAVDGQEARSGCLQLPSAVQVIATEALPASKRGSISDIAKRGAGQGEACRLCRAIRV